MLFLFFFNVCGFTSQSRKRPSVLGLSEAGGGGIFLLEEESHGGSDFFGSPRISKALLQIGYVAFQYCTIQGCAGSRIRLAFLRCYCTKAVTSHVIKKSRWWQSSTKKVLSFICPDTQFFSLSFFPPSNLCTYIYLEMPSSKASVPYLQLYPSCFIAQQR